LEVYNSTKLVLSGNSSHMATWHAKLGFVAGPCVATLHSLTADGGNVAAIDVVVIKVSLTCYSTYKTNIEVNIIGVPRCLHRVHRGRGWAET
jgi:breast cancer 2 susceptibility protein